VRYYPRAIIASKLIEHGARWSIIAIRMSSKSWGEGVDESRFITSLDQRQANSILSLHFFDTVWSRRSYTDLLCANYLQKPLAV
jgi:hypothetical protein